MKLYIHIEAPEIIKAKHAEIQEQINAIDPRHEYKVLFNKDGLYLDYGSSESFYYFAGKAWDRFRGAATISKAVEWIEKSIQKDQNPYTPSAKVVERGEKRYSDNKEVMRKLAAKFDLSALSNGVKVGYSERKNTDDIVAQIKAAGIKVLGVRRNYCDDAILISQHRNNIDSIIKYIQ